MIDTLKFIFSIALLLIILVFIVFLIVYAISWVVALFKGSLKVHVQTKDIGYGDKIVGHVAVKSRKKKLESRQLTISLTGYEKEYEESEDSEGNSIVEEKRKQFFCKNDELVGGFMYEPRQVYNHDFELSFPPLDDLIDKKPEDLSWKVSANLDLPGADLSGSTWLKVKETFRGLRKDHI